MSPALMPIIQTSVRTPRTAADLIMSMDLDRNTLWTALALVAIVNTLMLYFVVQFADPRVEVPSYFGQPMTLFLLNAGLMVAYIHAMYWAGLAIGGQGRLLDVVAVVVWFQALWVLAQAGTMLLSLAIPALGSLVSLAVAIWGFWIFMNFLAAALHLTSPWHSLAVLLVSFLGLVFGFGILVAVFGGLLPAGV
ncbi:MAG: Yip1 family protein [Pseudomonadota bacterium]